MRKKVALAATAISGVAGIAMFLAAVGAGWTAAQGTPWSTFVPLMAVAGLALLLAAIGLTAVQLFVLRDLVRTGRSTHGYAKRSSSHLLRLDPNLRGVLDQIHARQITAAGLDNRTQELAERLGQYQAELRGQLDTFTSEIGELTQGQRASAISLLEQLLAVREDLTDRIQALEEFATRNELGELIESMRDSTVQSIGDLTGTAEQTVLAIDDLKDKTKRLSDATAEHANELRRAIEVTSASLTDSISGTQKALWWEYRQLEALFGIYAALDPERPLSPFRDWAVSPDCGAYLIGVVEQKRPRSVVEMGSGLSTVLIAGALARNGQGRVTAFEHDETYLELTRGQLEAHGLEAYADLVHAALVEVTVDNETFTWYDLNDTAFTTPVDLLFVDGPPHQQGKLSRYPALPLFFKHLATDAVVLLDDAARPAEADTVDRWLREFGGFRLTVVQHEKGTAQLTRFDA